MNLLMSVSYTHLDVYKRQIYECPIPIISAVGHEIDFTIADYVAAVSYTHLDVYKRQVLCINFYFDYDNSY